MDKSVKIELLDIGVILLGIAVSTKNVIAITLGVIGFGVIAAGYFGKTGK